MLWDVDWEVCHQDSKKSLSEGRHNGKDRLHVHNNPEKFTVEYKIKMKHVVYWKNWKKLKVSRYGSGWEEIWKNAVENRINNKAHAPKSVQWTGADNEGERRDIAGWKLEQFPK